MLESLALIILIGLAVAQIFTKFKLPKLVGMLFTGIILGPYVLNVLDESILAISADLRQIALIIILLRAGLALDLKDLKQVGRSAILMSFLPASFEILAYTFIGPILFDISKLEGAIIGSVLAAVSPAVVVPKMVYLIENKWGTRKSIPQMILASASIDDIYVIVIFTTLIGMSQGESVGIANILNIPASIIFGILLGVLAGFILYYYFESSNKKAKRVRNSIKLLIILGTSFLLISLEAYLKEYIAFSGLLAIIVMASTLKIKSPDSVVKNLSEKFGKLWIWAEIMLFVLVGAAVDIRYTMGAGSRAIALILLALVFRSIGVLISIKGAKLKMKEKLFCIIAYLPKATVQAAIGSVPLALGLNCGSLVLSIAVLGILITAPLGAVGMDRTYETLLSNDSD